MTNRAISRGLSVPILGALLAPIVLLAPSAAHACAVCFSGRSDESRQAFIGTTALLTFLPMIAIGAILWWLRRRWLAMQAEVPVHVAND